MCSSDLVDGFLLSPGFSAENTQYVIWLPYETEDVTVSATPADSRANVIVEGGFNLIAGADNEIKVICTAENGVQKVYTVIAKRAAAHSAEPDDSTEPTEPTDPTEPSEPADPTQPAAAEPSGSAPVFQESPRQQNAADKAMVMAMVAGVVCLAAGLGIGFFIGKKSGKSK